MTLTRRTLLRGGVLVGTAAAAATLAGAVPASAYGAQPYVGEIRIFAGNFAPAGWLFCDGQQLPISENDVLFQLIGTTYGGDGQETFALPDLRGRVPVHMGTGTDGISHQLAETAGTEHVTLTVQQIPTHRHVPVAGGSSGVRATPAGGVWAASPTARPYTDAAPQVPLHPAALAPTGGSQPHDNMQPYLAVNFIISLFGVFPSPT
ncbi:phage tail protein [Trujillonella humicola]|uniref:phage tail protein n=1 Tax=Trujillonella humicola TaxID=3383699 RepID=UPI003906A217